MKLGNEENVAKWLEVRSTKEERSNGLAIVGEYEILPPNVDNQVAINAKRNYLLSVHGKNVDVRIITMPVMLVTVSGDENEEWVAYRDIFQKALGLPFASPDHTAP